MWKRIALGKWTGGKEDGPSETGTHIHPRAIPPPLPPLRVEPTHTDTHTHLLSPPWCP